MTIQEEKKFVQKCEEQLPKKIIIHGRKYQLDVYGLISGEYRIVYARVVKDEWNYNDKIYDKTYKIDKSKKANTSESGFIIKKSVHEVIQHCLQEIAFIKKDYSTLTTYKNGVSIKSHNKLLLIEDVSEHIKNLPPNQKGYMIVMRRIMSKPTGIPPASFTYKKGVGVSTVLLSKKTIEQIHQAIIKYEEITLK